MSRSNYGFTLVEMVVVIAVIGIITACSLPFILKWKEKSIYVGTMQTLVTNLQKSKMIAIRENNDIDVEIQENSYITYLDNDSSDDFDSANDTLISQAQLPNGYRISPYPITFEFNPRGTIPAFSSEQTIQVMASNGKTGIISINMIGRIAHAY